MNSEQIIEQIKKSTIPDIEKYLICILIRNGLRISEITHCQNIKLIGNQLLSVWQKKTKTIRTANVVDFQQLTKYLFINGNLTVWNRDRYYYYRVFKRLGISELLIGRQHKSVTHLPRHKIATEIYNETNSIELVTAQLGHKSTRSASHYLPPKPQPTVNQRGILSTNTGTANNLRISIKGIIYAAKK